MEISKTSWQKYLTALRKVNDTATEKMLYYIEQFGMPSNQETLTDFIWAAFNISSKYGEAAAELAAEMYDAVALASEINVAAAELAPTPTIGEVAKAVNGTLKTQNPKIVAEAVGRMVKMTGVDTTMQNALRDGAEWAWIPSGDTCAFCIALASRGWQRASKDAIKDGHAEHIHANCDCTYAVRFDRKSNVAGYRPEEYRQMYDSAEGGTPAEKINAMRREFYAENKDAINAQKRAAYDRRTEFKSVLEQYEKTATPGKGEKIVEPGRKDKNRESANFDLLYDTYGGDITMLAESRESGKKNPDYLWRKKLWEEQEPISSSRTAVDQNTREAIHQIIDNPGGIVLDIGDSEMPTAEVKEIVHHRLRRSSPFGCDVVLIRNGSIEDIWRYKKR